MTHKAQASEVTQADIRAALDHLGWDDYEEFCEWALSNNEMDRFDDLCQALARHRTACPHCKGTGAKDYAGFAMDPCDHRLASHASTDRPTSRAARLMLALAGDCDSGEDNNWEDHEWRDAAALLRDGATHITTLEANIARMQAAMREAVGEEVSRIRAVPMYRSHCNCDPPGHERDCRGNIRAEDAYEFADKDDERVVAAFLRATLLSDAPEDRGDVPAEVDALIRGSMSKDFKRVETPSEGDA